MQHSEFERWALDNGATLGEARMIDTLARGLCTKLLNKEDAQVQFRIDGKNGKMMLKWEG